MPSEPFTHDQEIEADFKNYFNQTTATDLPRGIQEMNVNSLRNRRRPGLLVITGGALLFTAAAAAAVVAVSFHTTAAVVKPASTLTPIATPAPTSTPEVVSPSPTPDQTAGWISYTSVANHLTVKHPGSWSLVDCSTVQNGRSSSIALGPPTPTCSYDLIGRVVLSGMVNASATYSSDAYETSVQHTDVVVDGVLGRRTSAVMTSQYQGNIVSYEFITNGRYYRFDLLAAYGDASTGLTTADFDQMVQTIMFS